DFAGKRTTTREVTHGSIYRDGCPRANVLVGGVGTDRATSARARRRDEWQDVDRDDSRDRGNPASVHGGGDAEPMVVRDPRASRGGSGRRAGGEARRQQERLARCMGIGGTTSDGSRSAETRLQKQEAAGTASGGAGSTRGDDQHGASEEP